MYWHSIVEDLKKKKMLPILDFFDFGHIPGNIRREIPQIFVPGEVSVPTCHALFKQ